MGRAKRAAELAGFLVDEVVEDVGHARWVFTVPKMLRVYFLYHRELLGELSRAAAETVKELLAAAAGEEEGLLDQVSDEVPVIIVHQSGHLASANTPALALVDYDSTTDDPPGGVIQRKSGTSEPNGTLEETAFFPLFGKVLQQIGPLGLEELSRAGAENSARFGYTTAQEARSAPDTVDIMRKVAAEGDLTIDVATYPDVLVDREYILANQSDDYVNHLRVAGAKLTIDGSPQGFTAWRDQPYYDPVGDNPEGYSGYPAATEEQVMDAVDWA